MKLNVKVEIYWKINNPRNLSLAWPCPSLALRLSSTRLRLPTAEVTGYPRTCNTSGGDHVLVARGATAVWLVVEGPLQAGLAGYPNFSQDPRRIDLGMFRSREPRASFPFLALSPSVAGVP